MICLQFNIRFVHNYSVYYKYSKDKEQTQNIKLKLKGWYLL